MIYTEARIGFLSSHQCDTCGQHISWPEHARIYGKSLKAPVEHIEHARHPALTGALVDHRRKRK